MTRSILDAEYWSNRYLENKTGWDIGFGSSPLTKYISQLKDKNISILIPGCGNAYEAEILLEQGFKDVTVLDISPVLTEELKKKFINKPIKIINTDFFDHTGEYDLILEQTFFCALDPMQRNDYAEKMVTLLKPGGKLVGVLFNRQFEGGPPFGGTKEEYELLFSKIFSIKKMELCYNSIEARKNSELFIILQK
jgi:SAM-dependent methyltransferase